MQVLVHASAIKNWTIKTTGTHGNKAKGLGPQKVAPSVASRTSMFEVEV